MTHDHPWRVLAENERERDKVSGGSMDYLYAKVEGATFRLNTPERRALYKHLQRLSKALRAIEWNDSGDGDPDERELILQVLGYRPTKR